MSIPVTPIPIIPILVVSFLIMQILTAPFLNVIVINIVKYDIQFKYIIREILRLLLILIPSTLTNLRSKISEKYSGIGDFLPFDFTN